MQKRDLYFGILPLFFLAALALGACNAPTGGPTTAPTKFATRVIPTVIAVTETPAGAPTPTATTPQTSSPTAAATAASATIQITIVSQGPPAGSSVSPTNSVTSAPATRTPTSATPTQQAQNCPQGQACITISPTSGDVKKTNVQVTVRGQGFPAGHVTIAVGPKPGNVPIAGGPITVSGARAGSNGTFETAFVMPADQPSVADTRDLQVLAFSADGTKGASADFRNTGGVDLSNAIINDYTSPVFGFRFQIPTGWRARQGYEQVDAVHLYNPAEGTRPGGEPIVVRAVPSKTTINGKAVSQMSLEEYARIALPNESPTGGKQELVTLQPLLHPSGLPVYQAIWRMTGGSGVNPTTVTNLVITYMDLNRTINGQYYRTVQVTMNQAAPYGGEYGGVISTLNIVPLKPPASAEAARATVEGFMVGVIGNDFQKATNALAPTPKQRVQTNDVTLPTLLGIQNIPAKFAVTNAAIYSPAPRQADRAVIKGYMGFDPPAPVQFELSQSGAGGAWLIDEIIPLQ